MGEKEKEKKFNKRWFLLQSDGWTSCLADYEVISWVEMKSLFVFHSIKMTANVKNKIIASNSHELLPAVESNDKSLVNVVKLQG